MTRPVHPDYRAYVKVRARSGGTIFKGDRLDVYEGTLIPVRDNEHSTGIALEGANCGDMFTAGLHYGLAGGAFKVVVEPNAAGK